MKQTIGKMSSQGGFTLIEIISILLIIGIIAAVAIIRMTSPAVYDLASQVEVVKAHLRLAQSRAMSSSSSCGINFSSPTTYYLFDGSAPNAPVLMLGEQNAIINLGAEGKKSVLTITPPSGGRVTFNKFGSPVDSSGNQLNANMGITTSGSIITITKNTGFIP
ncbi:MAG: prepilin-type N-terminal cleavage/methylation domain-containing protein [Smithella sp.]